MERQVLAGCRVDPGELTGAEKAKAASLSLLAAFSSIKGDLRCVL
jgi:hypothetical protein